MLLLTYYARNYAGIIAQCMQEQTSNKGEMGDETGLLLCSTYISVPLKYVTGF